MCEVYSVLIDEWYLIGCLIVFWDIGNMLLIDEFLYVLGGVCYFVYSVYFQIVERCVS